MLNNSGINLHYISDSSINLDIINDDNINEDIPILIKFIINKDNINLVNNEKNFELNKGQIGVYKFESEKKIKMGIKSEKENLDIYYYIDYLSKDYLNNTDDLILSPEIFNKKEYSKEKINFEISTELEITKTEDNNNLIKSDLYLIFSFNEKVIINYEDDEDEEEDDDGGNGSKIAIIIVTTILSVLIILSILYYFFVYKKKKKNKLLEANENNPFNQAETLGKDDNKVPFYNKPEENDYPDISEFRTNEGNYNIINNSNFINNEENLDLPAPSPM